MDALSITATILGGAVSILSIIFAILTFSRNGRRDNIRLEQRLTGMEKDILYIRKSLDGSNQWHNDIEKRVERLERKK